MLCLANSPEMLNVKAPPPQKKRTEIKNILKKISSEKPRD